MNLKALVTSLVLGTSSLAMAAPTAPAYAPTVRDHRVQPVRPMPLPAPHAQRWSQLATGHLARGKAAIKLNTRHAIDKLKLELVGPGQLFVDKLVVTFGNGRSQTIEVDRWLTARSAAAIVDVNGKHRKITKVTVYGRGNGSGIRAGASFKLLAL